MGSVTDALGSGISVATGGLIDGGDLLGSFTGENAADAARDASRTQVALGREAIEEQRLAREEFRELTEPFVAAGTESLPLLQQAISDPSSRVLSNPFFQALAGEQEQRLMASQAARGKLGSGETNMLLQRNLLNLGQQFAQQDIGNLFNLSTLGANIAAGQGSAGMQTAQTTGNLLTQIGNARAAGIVGEAQAEGQLLQNIIGIGSAAAPFFACDERLKENKKPVRVDSDGLTVYEFNYIGDDSVYEGKMAHEIKEIDPEHVTESDEGYLLVTEKYAPKRVA